MKINANDKHCGSMTCHTSHHNGHLRETMRCHNFAQVENEYNERQNTGHRHCERHQCCQRIKAAYHTIVKKRLYDAVERTGICFITWILFRQAVWAAAR